MWLYLNYGATLISDTEKAKTVFNVYPEGVPVKIGGNIMIFNSENMNKYKEHQSSTFVVGEELGFSKDNVPKKINYYDEKILELNPEYIDENTDKYKDDNEKRVAKYSEYIDKIKTKNNILTLSQINYYTIPPANFPYMVVELDKNENFNPEFVEIIVGRGEIPADFKKYISESNGNWFLRHKNFCAIMLTIFSIFIYIFKKLKD